MKGGKTPLGYTIIEVMIVLAVSGMMFVIAASFINGRQQSTAFTQGVNEMASQIQGMIEQVTDGHYSDIPINCVNGSELNPDGVPVLSFNVGGTQGENSNCTFIGKLIQFNYQGDQNKYAVLTVAAARNNNSRPVTSLSDAKVTGVITHDRSVDFTTYKDVPQSLDVKSVTIVRSNGTSVKSDYDTNSNINTSTNYAVGILQSLGNADSEGNLQSGAQTVNLYYIGLITHDDAYATSTHLSLDLSNLTPPPLAKSVNWCVTDGTRYGEVLLGVNDNGSAGNPLSVSVKMNGTTPC